MITCQHLMKQYQGKKVLNDLSFHIREGEVYGLLGPNGAGKTTTIKMILGLGKLDSGHITLQQRHAIGYSPETPYFYPYLTAYQTLLFYAKLQRIPKDQQKQDIISCLKRVGLDPSMKQPVGKFSKGMLQRLAFAQALLGQPQLLILDEPCAGLDALGRIEMKKLILKLKHEGKTILLNSHILSDVASVADRVGIIKDGTMVKELDMTDDHHAHDLEKIFIQVIGGDLNDDDCITSC